MRIAANCESSLSPAVLHRSSRLPRTQEHGLRVASTFVIAFGSCPRTRVSRPRNIPKAGTDPFLDFREPPFLGSCQAATFCQGLFQVARASPGVAANRLPTEKGLTKRREWRRIETNVATVFANEKEFEKDLTEAAILILTSDRLKAGLRTL